MKKAIRIKGMYCAACVTSIEDNLKKLDGVDEVYASLTKKMAMVSYDEEKVSMSDIVKKIKKIGYDVPENTKESSSQYRVIILLILTLLNLYLSMGPMLNIKIPFNLETSALAYAITLGVLSIVTMALCFRIYVSGIKHLFIGNPNMDSLVSIGTIAAFGYGIYSLIMILNGDQHAVHNLYFDSVSTILTLVTVGKFIEEKAIKKTSSSIEKLMNLTPNEVYRVIGKKTELIKIDEVKINDILLARSGDAFSVDGKIIKGETSVDESMLTGEPIPVDKELGDLVYAGTINKKGTVQYQALSIGENTILEKIIKMVENAELSKPKIARFADRISRVFVPTIFVIAVLGFIFWFIFGDFISAIKVFVTVLVIACPCALGLATPTAITIGLGIGARNGILYKNANVLEELSNVNLVFFDKTGTLTKGTPTVENILIEGDKELYLKIIKGIEKHSTHPLAKAIVDKIPFEVEVENVEVLTGYGMSALYQGMKILVGSDKLMREQNIKIPVKTYPGRSMIYLSVDSKYKGVITLFDELKMESSILIDKLKERGLKTIILTGDNEVSAKEIVKKVNVDKIYSSLLPMEKADIIKKYRDKNVSLYIGDGINDAVALKEASIGMSTNTSTDVAMETSDIVLMSNNLLDMLKAIDLSKATIKNIKGNFFWAFFYNLIGVGVALFGILNPMIAALAMSLSSICVVTNALRLNRIKF